MIGERRRSTARRHRRHDRHCRHDLCRGGAARRSGRDRRLGDGDPPASSRTLRLTGSRPRRSAGSIVTDTLPLPPERRIDKIEVLSVAPIIADAIDAVFEDTSVSEIFGGQNLS